MEGYTLYLLFILPLCSFVTLALYNIHMLQLNSYRLKRYFKWQGKNPNKLIGLSRLLGMISVCAATAAWVVLGGTMDSINFLLVALLCALQVIHVMYLLNSRLGKAKKPLVITNRVKRLFVVCVALAVAAAILDASITLGVMLVIPHIFAFCVVSVATVITMPFEFLNRLRYIRDAKRKLAKMPNLIVIGITGSFGKTSTKYAVYRFLSARFNVLMTPESYNTPMGVVKTIREQLNGTHEVFIVEMGAKQKGDIREICNIVKPKYGIITSIGEQHLETFKSISNIAATKFELVDALPKNGVAFLNFDNKIIRERKVDKRVVSYGYGKCDYLIHGMQSGVYGSRFYIKTPNDDDIYFETRLLGQHNCLNVAAACAVATHLGVHISEQKLASIQQEGVAHRLQLIPTTRYTLIDDSYNSNPAGAQAALDVLSEFDGFKVLVTPGLVELGERQDTLNYQLGEAAAQVCDMIILVGKPEKISPIKRGCHKFDQQQLKTFDTITEALNYVNKHSEDYWVVLLLNDLPDNYT